MTTSSPEAWPHGEDDLESDDYPMDPPAHLDPDSNDFDYE